MFCSVRPNDRLRRKLHTEHVLIRLVAEKLRVEENLKELANKQRQPVQVEEVDSDEQPLTTPAQEAEKTKRKRSQGPKPSANEVDNPRAGGKRSLDSAFQAPAKATTATSKVTAKPSKEDKTSPLVPFGPGIGAKVAARLPSGAGVHYGLIKKIHAGTGNTKTTYTVEFEDGEVKAGLSEGMLNKQRKPNKPMTLVPYDGDVKLQNRKKK
jgi:hypothetical protein